MGCFEFATYCTENLTKISPPHRHRALVVCVQLLLFILIKLVGVPCYSVFEFCSLYHLTSHRNPIAVLKFEQRFNLLISNHMSDLWQDNSWSKCFLIVFISVSFFFNHEEWYLSQNSSSNSYEPLFVSLYCILQFDSNQPILISAHCLHCAPKTNYKSYRKYIFDLRFNFILRPSDSCVNVLNYSELQVIIRVVKITASFTSYK